MLSSSGQAATDQMEIRLLGPFEVALAGRAVAIGSPKQRAIMALLALHTGRVVSTGTLCDLIWNEEPPASPAATLQSLISRLRAVLAGREVLRTREPGWVLDVEPGAVDAHRFQELAARARSRLGRGEAAAAAVDLTEALGLWRGAALVDMVDVGYLAPFRTRLDEARLDTVEDLAEAQLAVGRPAEALDLLEGHVATNLLRERGWGLMMVALYRLGRQAAALRAFQQARTALKDTLGLEPSPELAKIELGILRHDPDIAGPARPGPGSGSALVPPAAPATSVPERPTVSDEFADYSVVVVEDHDFQRRTVVHLLRNLGVGTVRDSANGTEALELLQAGPEPDIIICDIDMPGMDGVEFVGRVAERTLSCAIVIASGLEVNVLRAVETIGQAHGLQVLAAIEKPLTARRLGEVLRQYTRRSGDRAGQSASVPVSREELAVALDCGGVAMHFEPRVDLTTGAISSVEGGGIWSGPDGHPVPPPTFAAAVGRVGLLPALVERLVAAAAPVLGALPVRVALDLSPLPLADSALADRLAAMVHAQGHDPQRFVWVLDDVALARAPTPAMQVLTRLRVKGFGLAMNHGGAGPSRTQQLGRVPLSELKLERRLVHAATGDPKHFAVLESTVAAARREGLPVVADGCDSRPAFDMIVAVGCSEAQGQFVASGMPAADIVEWASAGFRPDEPGGRP